MSNISIEFNYPPLLFLNAGPGVTSLGSILPIFTVLELELNYGSFKKSSSSFKSIIFFPQ